MGRPWPLMGSPRAPMGWPWGPPGHPMGPSRAQEPKTVVFLMLLNGWNWWLPLKKSPVNATIHSGGAERGLPMAVHNKNKVDPTALKTIHAVAKTKIFN